MIVDGRYDIVYELIRWPEFIEPPSKLTLMQNDLRQNLHRRTVVSDLVISTRGRHVFTLIMAPAIVSYYHIG